MDPTRSPSEEVEGTPSPGDAPEAEGELRLGSTERGIAANGVVLALTRAARSFLLYDPSNEAIRHFLHALRTTVEAYLATFGELPLVVRPFELVVGGEVVYLDRDRERSLAFRLFRDGVRRVTLEAGLTWDEVLKLLEILSIRYTGVRQAEDDMVVLLWKAGFTNIQLEAVEGFVPEEEVGDGAGAGAPAGSRGGTVEAPPDFDLPAPVFTVRGPLRYRPLLTWETEALLVEDSTQALPQLCVRLTRELLVAVADPTDPITLAEIVPQLREIRDFLLAEGLLDAVLEMVRSLARARLASPGDLRERDALLETFGDERAVGRLLRSVPRNATTAPPEMLELLDLLPGNHLEMVVRVLDTEKGEASRRVARSLIERFVPRQGDWILQQLATLEAGVAIELLRALAAADPARGVEAVAALTTRHELELQLEALHVLERLPPGPATARLLTGFAAAPNEEVRIRALELLGRNGVRTAFPAILERVKRDAALRLSQREATAAGEALARCDPGRASDVFREWLKPRGLFTSVLPGQAMLQWVGVSGLVYLGGDEPEALIKHVAERAGSELARHCTACMVKRRRVARGHLPGAP
jgi:HEAT repeat protein